MFLHETLCVEKKYSPRQCAGVETREDQKPSEKHVERGAAVSNIKQQTVAEPAHCSSSSRN